MDIALPPIRFGPNAGQPQAMNDVLLSRVSAVRNALIRVRNAGYHAIDVRIDGVRPTVRLEVHSDFSRLIEEGVACYYVSRIGAQDMPERVGQFHVDGVRFIWTERGH